MYIPPEAIKVALSSVGVVYKGVKTAWEFYQTSQHFGADFEISISMLQTQEWIFASHLHLLGESINMARVTGTLSHENKWSEDVIVGSINLLVDHFTECYELTKDYATKSQGSKDGCDHERKKLHRSSGSQIEEGGIRYLILQQSRKVRQAGQEAEKKSKTPIVRTAQGVEIVPPESSDAARASSHINPFSKLEDLKRERNEKARLFQTKTGIQQRAQWAHHGKEKFDNLIGKLKEGNDELRNILPLAVPKDPFKKIRVSGQLPTLLNDTKDVRDTLEKLHTSMRISNEEATNGAAPLTVAVKLDEEPQRTIRWMETRGILNLRARPGSEVFSMLPLMTLESACQKEHTILVTSISRIGPNDRGRFQNSQAEFERLMGLDQEAPCRTMGYVECENDLSFSFQLIETSYNQRDGLPPNLELSLQHIVGESENKRQQEKSSGNIPQSNGRICLSAKLALSHAKFMAINRDTACRNLDSYLLMPEARDFCSNEVTHWWDDAKIRSSLWVAFGLGESPKVRNTSTNLAGWQSLENFSTLDQATELGLLICQVAAAKKLGYYDTADDVQRARVDAKLYLHRVEEETGLFMREIVETCFLSSEGSFTAETIIEEVASALDHIARGLKSRA